MAERKKRVRAHVIADMSLHHLAYTVVSCSFTVETTKADYGYDLSIFTFDGAGHYENGNVFVQLKATDSLKVDNGASQIKFRLNKRDILTWEDEPFPAYLVVFDAKHGKAYCIYLQQYLSTKGISSRTMKGDSVEVRLPATEIDIGTIQRWRNDKNAVLKQIGAVQHV